MKFGWEMLILGFFVTGVGILNLTCDSKVNLIIGVLCCSVGVIGVYDSGRRGNKDENKEDKKINGK